MKSHHSDVVTVYNLKRAGWILGVPESEVCRLIRRGVLPTVRRRRRLVVPAYALARLVSGDPR